MIVPEGGAPPIPNCHTRRGTVQRNQGTERAPVITSRGRAGLNSDGAVANHGPPPGSPWRVAVNVEAMEKLDEEAGVLDGESTHPHPTLILGSANLVPCDQTLGPADALARIPEEGAAKGIQSLDDGGRELHGRHSMGGERI